MKESAGTQRLASGARFRRDVLWEGGGFWASEASEILSQGYRMLEISSAALGRRRGIKDNRAQGYTPFPLESQDRKKSRERLSVGLVSDGSSPSALGHSLVLTPAQRWTWTKSWGQLAQLEKQGQPPRASPRPRALPRTHPEHRCSLNAPKLMCNEMDCIPRRRKGAEIPPIG